MSKRKTLLGLAAVGVSVFGFATALWRWGQTPSRAHRASYHVSQPAATPPRTRETLYQKEQIEQVRDHKV
jgi:hypothetical protein